MKMRFTSPRAISRAAVLAVFTAIGQAHAALPPGFAGSVTQYQADTVEALGLLMAAGVVIWGVMRLKSKLGL